MAKAKKGAFLQGFKALGKGKSKQRGPALGKRKKRCISTPLNNGLLRRGLLNYNNFPNHAVEDS